MRLTALAALSATSALLPATTALPHQEHAKHRTSPPSPNSPKLITIPSQDPYILPREDRTIDGVLVKDYHNDTITLGLGQSARNVGTRVNQSLYNEIFSAVKTSCGRRSDKGCAAAVNDKTVPRASFEVFVGRGSEIKRERLVVYMQSAFWDGKGDIYDLLVDAVAGAAVRTTWSDFNCYMFWGYNRDGTDAEYKFCNMLDKVNVGFANKYWMNVTFDSTMGSMESGAADCWSVKEDAKDYIETNVMGKLEKALKWADGTAWVKADCIS